jgi:lipid II:glycine glycyltransferase (peptidoglycan interpeptide bridge formation enzyme)
MKFIPLENYHDLNSFLNKQDFSQFLQSSYWLNILRAQGQKAHVLSVVDDDENILLTCLFVENKYKSFKYYYMPRGPILDKRYQEDKEGGREIVDFFFKKFQDLIVDKSTLFLRLEPKFEYMHTREVFLERFANFKIERSLDIQPSKTRVLDLERSEKELLEDMHSKTRYNIRLAKKKGVEIISAKKESDLDIFINLLKTTGERNKFSLHQEKHYRNIYENGKDKVKIFFAKHDNDIIAGAMFSFFGDTVTYLHGASANEKRNLMAPHLLQWQTILRSKDKGFKYYDFGGINEKKWPGVTRFKAGFGGSEYDFQGTIDFVLKPIDYRLYTLARKIRRKFL